MPLLIDITNDTEWKTKLLEKIDCISKSHYNNENYKTFDQRIDNYDCLTIVVENNDIKAMSGLYNNNIYPKHIARGIDRLYYFNWPRSLDQKVTNYTSKYMWPYQVSKAKELGYEIIFISMQNPRKKKALENRFLAFNPRPHMLTDLYNTCPKQENLPLCWQNIGIFKIKKDSKFNLPSMTREEYAKLF